MIIVHESEIGKRRVDMLDELSDGDEISEQLVAIILGWG